MVLDTMDIIGSLFNIQFLLLCLLLFLIFKWMLGERPQNLPPGPRGWPVLGSLPTFIYLMAVRGLGLQDVYAMMIKEYGPIFTYHFVGMRLVIVSKYEVVKELLSHPQFEGRLKESVEDAQLKGEGLIFGHGESWKEQRKFTLAVLRGYGVGKRSFEEQITEETTRLIDQIRSHEENHFDPSKLLANAASNILFSVVIGKRFEYDDEEFSVLLNLLDEKFNRIGRIMIVNALPFLLNLPFGPGKKMRVATDQIMSHMKNIIQEHRLARDPDHPRDFIDVWLNEAHCNKEKGIDSAIDEDNLVRITLDLFLAGAETTSTTLRWAILYMMAFPEVQKKVQEELDNVVGRDRLPKLSDKPNLPFTVATLNEIQRFSSITTIGRYNFVDATLAGYTIPKGTMAMSYIYGVSRDEAIWNNPTKFDPTRFLDEEGKVVRREEILFFGAGRRQCIGEQVGGMELFIIFSHFLHQFTFKAKENEDLNLKPTAQVTFTPNPFVVSFVER